MNKNIIELGAKLTKQLKENSTEAPPLFIGLMNDSFLFYADLIRCVNIDITCDFIDQNSVDLSQVKMGEEVKDKNVVLVLGKKVSTLDKLKNDLEKRGVKSVTTVIESDISKP